MKKNFLLLILISTSIFGQNYDKNWLKVIEFENEGKIKSANEIVSKIHQKATRDKDEVQIIKCFFYESKYLQVLDEDAQTKIINNLKAEINKVSIPSKAILNLVYAKCLIDYRNKNSYLLYNRTNTVSFDDQFLTWTSKDFSEQIDGALEKTILNETILKQTSLSTYLQIFDYSDEEKAKKDNLFNYLVKENIALYTPQIRQWEIQKKEFLPYEKGFLENSVSFVQLNFDFVKNEKLKKVLELYQKQEKNAPTLENQFDRIQFCNSVLLDSNEGFMKSLQTMQKESKDTILIQKIQLEKAIILNNLASKEIHPDYNIQAIATLDSILKINNRSNAHKIALQKIQNIQAKSLNIQLQKFSYENENTRAFIRYKNLNQLSISFFKIDQNTTKDFRNSPHNKDSLVAAIIKNKKAIASKNYALEEKNNYFEYSTEVLLPQLKTGSYLVYFESDSDLKNTKAFAYETITVSNITVLTSENDKKENYQVLDRKTGKPLENVSIKLLNQTIITDKSGNATYTKKNNNRNYSLIEFTTETDSLLLNSRYSYYNNDYDYETLENQKAKGKVEFYLDRAIYRPGQTVYYKGIAFRKDQDKTSVVAKTAFKITIKDPNGSVLKEFEAVTNEYGSFSGEFLLPKSGLTGNFRITADEPDESTNFVFIKTKDEHPFWDNVNYENSQISFQVEEYKRPKFEVTFEPFKNAYQVNQKVSVNGLARAFAGSNISDAKVTYKVSLIPYTLNNGYYYNQNGKSESILVGETTTDASGKFDINFIAKPFENTSKKQLPIFEYSISASVTDSNGETHQAQTNVRVGYHSLTLTATIPNRIETKNKNEIEVKSTNLNGEFLATKGEIKLYYVSPFTTKFKPRVFPQPEIESISAEDFEQLFPYEDNNQPNASKPTETLVFSKKIDTEKDKKVALDFISNYKSGNYKVVFSAIDTFENPIETSTNFQLIQSKDKIDSSKLFTAKQINADAKKDGFVLVQLTSIIPELYINTTGNYQSFLYFENTFHLQNNETIIKIPLKKEFEKSMKIAFESVFENQTFYEQIEVILREEESKLQFTVESFRNKLQPGTNENWSFQIKSINTAKETEVLASMYDSSLDQFAKRDWNSLKFNDYNYNSANFKTSIGFDKTSIYIRNLNPIPKRMELIDETTKLIWFGFNFNDSFTTQQLKEYQKQLNNKSKKPLNAKMISGIVTDDQGPLSGVSIIIDGLQRSTQTDFDGYYQIEAAIGEEITFSYIGFETQKITIKSNIINVQLEDSSNSLQEVVVMGYRSVNKKGVAAAVPAVVEEADNQIYNTAGIEIKLEGKASGITIRGNSNISGNYKNALYIVDGEVITEEQFRLISPTDIIAIDVLKEKKATAVYGSKGANGVIIITTKKALESLTQVKARKNLSETAFFYPNLKTDTTGKVSFNFTSPEALTAWKLRLLAHNKEATSGYLEKSVITQKELMVIPNFPRFFREKDSIFITTKVANITNEAKTGIAVLQLFDATTMQPIDAIMENANSVKNFKIAPFGNTTVTWKIYVPEGLQGVQYKVLAKAGNFSDGEENLLPVLTNSMLVTESIPIWVRENSKKEYTFENLKNNNSTSLQNHQFTLEYTSNPSWLAIQSLPYLMEYEHESAEHTFARFYANALASEIISSNPKIATLFETWRKNEKLNSKLEENEELKAIIIAETPWLKDAKTEEEKKKNLALLFDLEKMKNAQEITFDKLKQKQTTSGGFAWFEGSTENEYITRHILAGLGHLAKLSNNENTASKIKQITTIGIPFLDKKFLENHKTRTEKLKTKEKLIWFNPYSDLHYLYTRSSYLKTYPLSDTLQKATKLYLEIAKNEWLTYSLYEKGLAALTLDRFGEKEAAKIIMASLKETASNNEDWGMYWIANKSGYFWYQAPIETQALLIEAFAEITNDTKSVDAMKVWLLKNKQTKNWPTTKSTTEAIYALLMQGTDWLSVKDNTIFKIGTEKILTKKLVENEKEAETGYVKLNWKADEIKKDMATISIENKSKVPGFGGIYWQYFEELDKIKTNSGIALSVSKELYVKKDTDKGEILERINSNNLLKIGDLVTVRLIISAKEDMEFVHLKDMRASCFEPTNVLSKYQYKGGLGFYQSTKDVATHFFFDQINKGTYVLEYDIRVNNKGDFSNGISTIQSMYAPEYSSHTKGIRVKVKE
ncbi:MG2 domain-containing protein [Flavobacterium sandaracinum]|uniref:Alpha-2-macroglobulin n=1 Tax=Flavobacterium sandaracinum TaxID=2541733 RepID=A0A4R5CLS3_9FLAO|nr:MG2 domain-containing protein [Flavobacterium sandaracinum]TDE00180.1 alpha-2-macroglobulin [Flavobacterium sandaracinum]